MGIAPQLSDAELVTLAVLQTLLGFTSALGFTFEVRWIRHASAHLGHLFPYVRQQPGYKKRLRAARGLVRHCIRTLAASTSLWTNDVWTRCPARKRQDRLPPHAAPLRRRCGTRSLAHHENAGGPNGMAPAISGTVVRSVSLSRSCGNGNPDRAGGHNNVETTTNRYALSRAGCAGKSGLGECITIITTKRTRAVL